MRLPGSNLTFEQAAAEAFAFLSKSGFRIVERDSTLLRFKRETVEIDVYQGRKSFEISLGIKLGEERFTLSELIGLMDAEVAAAFRNPVATDDEGVKTGVFAVASMMRRFGQRLLDGDIRLLGELMCQRRKMSEAFEMDVLAEKTRPLAQAAFKSGNYPLAVELYSRIDTRLSPSERVKLQLAQARSASRH